MYRGLRVAVVVPAYRESRLIGSTIRGIPSFVDRIVVVDDASEDATCAAAEAVGDARVHLVRHDVNRGVGAAIVTGYRISFDDGADVAVVMAGDAQMDPNDLPALLAPICEGSADYAKGNRLAFGGVAGLMPPQRFVGNHLFSRLTQLATGLDVYDSQCGYTVITRACARRLALDSLWPRYGYPNDLLGLLAEIGARVVDVPVRPVYATEKSGIGLRHALFVVPFVLLRLIARRIMPRARPALAEVSRER